MKVFRLFTVTALTVVTLKVMAHSSCDEDAARELFKQKYPQVDCVADAVKAHPVLGPAMKNACENGCDTAFLMNDYSCYEDALKGLGGQLGSDVEAISKKANCGLAGGAAPKKKGSGAADQCEWVHRDTVKVTCGGDKPAPVCPNLGGKAICTGRAICHGQFWTGSGVKDRALNKEGIWEVAAISKTGKCDGEGSPTMEEYFSWDKAVWLDTDDKKLSPELEAKLKKMDEEATAGSR